MESAIKKKLSLTEYRQLEEDNDTRYEFHKGEVFAMAGGSRSHSAIATNVTILLGSLLSEGCRPFNSDLKVYIPATNKGLYPDVSVVCQPIKEESSINAITNPVLLIEVLSKGTANYDRGEKFWFYSQVSSLREYVLIEQDQWAVETRYRDSEEALWEMAYFKGEGTKVFLRSKGIYLPMDQIYRDVANL